MIAYEKEWQEVFPSLLYCCLMLDEIRLVEGLREGIGVFISDEYVCVWGLHLSSEE